MSPDSSEASTVITARVRELRATTDRLAAQLDSVVDQLAEDGRRLAELATAVPEDLPSRVSGLQHVITEEVGRLRGEVDLLLAESRKHGQPSTTLVNWPELAEDAAAGQWAVLARWLGEVLVPTYELTRDELPDCWALHPAVVVELSWLRTAYVQAYLPGAASTLIADWHSRWRPAVLSRVHALTRECAPGRHVARRGPVVTVDGVDGIGTPRTQPAEPRCWWSFYARGVAEDLARRRARTRAAETTWNPVVDESPVTARESTAPQYRVGDRP